MSPSAFAQSARAELPAIDNPQQIRMPVDFRRVHFYLLTVDVGDKVWDNFGHTALRVIDENNGTDLVYNWGLFDISVGYVRFAADFALGIMDYQLGIAPPGNELGRYEQEQRTVWQDRINLSNPQKAALYRRLAWNQREENRVYDYDYFFDNCTTRVRDYLDEALRGSIYAQNTHILERSFRDEVITHYASIPVISLSLDVLMNSSIDRPMSQWEQMFLPMTLRHQLSGHVSDVFENGQRLNLLSESIVLMQFTPPERSPNVYLFIALMMLPLGFLMLSLRRIPISSFSNAPGFTFKVPGLSFRLLGLLGVVIGLVSGIYGTILVLGWLISGHEVLHHNINLLLFWPTDIIGAFIALRWLISGQTAALSSGKYQVVSFYLLGHLLAAIAYLGIGLLGLTDQRITSLMIFMVPCLLTFTIVVWTAGLRPVRAIRFK